jgi:hypothetical protein
LEEYIASIFRVKEQAERDTSMKAGNKQRKAICSFETLVDFQWTTQCYIPEDGTLQKVSFSR